MRPRPLHSRSDLVRIVREHAPSRGCQLAVDRDQTLVLGRFTPPQGLPCFIVQVNGLGRTWLVSVAVDEQAYQYRITYIDQVPWRHWAGEALGRDPLRDGDKPRQFAFKRMEARRAVRPNPTTP